MTDFKQLLAEECARETARSPHRDRLSGVRVHPIDYDVQQLVNFVLNRRISHPDALAACKRVMRKVDPAALRYLVDVALNYGLTTSAIRNRCKRVIGYVETIEKALEVGKRFKEAQ